MGAVGMLAGCEIRRRWRGVVVLTLVVGVVGAVVLATAAGARRSETALARFNAASRSSDLNLFPPFGYTPTPEQLSALRHVHVVSAVAVLRFYLLAPRGFSLQGGFAAAVDTKFARVVDRERIVAGRTARSSAIDEVTVGESLAARLHLRVGQHLDAMSVSTAQLQAVLAGGGKPSSLLGPRVRLRIVGIVRGPLDLGDERAGGFAYLTPAFDRAYFAEIGNLGVVLDVRTNHGASEVSSVAAASKRIFATSGGVILQRGSDATQGAQSAIDVLTLTLWILAGVVAVAGIVAVGIVLTREVSPLGVDLETLRALGLTRSQRVLTTAPRALLITAGGALVAVLGAVAASPLLPIGVARRADPSVGFHVDWVVLSLGILAIAGVVIATALLAAWRNTRRASLESQSNARHRASTIVVTLARVGLPPTTTSGLRMALEPGRGRTAVPVRSAFVGAVLGVLGVTAVLVFGSSLDHLGTTPRLYGSTWDFQATDTNFTGADNTSCNRDDFGLAQVQGVGSVAALCDNDVQLGGRPVTAWGFTTVRGTIRPEIVTGRAPRKAGEVALGSSTLHALGKRVGDTVQGRGPNGAVKYRIVGRAVLPTLGDSALADGAAFTGSGLSRIFDTNASSGRYLLGRFTPGVDRASVERRIAALPALGHPTGATVPVEVDRVRQVDWFPATLAALLGGIALLAVGHALVVAIRRRRHEIALLKTLGFNRRQVRATIAWQATTLASVGLVLGIPAGLIIGRVVWRLVANGLGISTTATIPALALLLTIPIALALVNLIAYLPARSAAQTRPAVALRSE